MKKIILQKILPYFIISRIYLILFAVIAAYILPAREGYLGNQFDTNAPYITWVWANFDGRHYLEIATEGYRNTNFAFFPLYPLLISFVKHIIPISPLYIGILVSLGFYILALYYLYLIAKLDYDNKIATLAIFASTFIPFSFFYHSVYTDSLFVFLATASFYYARQGKWWISGIFAGFAFLDRFSGIALIPGLSFEWYLQNKILLKKINVALKSFTKTGLIAICLCLVGIIAYMLYLQIYYGDFLLFQKTRSAWHSQSFVFPLQTVYRYLKIFWFLDKSLFEYWIALMEFISIILYFGLSYLVTKKIRPSYGIFMLFLLLIVPATGTFAGNPRYILHLFPVYILLAVWMKGNYRFKNMYLFTFLVLGFLLTAFFTRGYFIT